MSAKKRKTVSESEASELQRLRRELAKYHGMTAAACGVLGIMPSAVGAVDKQALEKEAFENWLQEMRLKKLEGEE